MAGQELDSNPPPSENNKNSALQWGDHSFDCVLEIPVVTMRQILKRLDKS
jgi:hypothetical protein